MSDLDNAQAGASVAPVENAAEQQTQAPSESTTEQVGEQQQEQQPRDEQGRFVQKRINELTRARREAERERDFYRQQFEAHRQQPQTTSQSQDKAPSLSDYKSVEEWSADFAAYTENRAIAKARQEFAANDQQRQQDTLRQTFEQKEAAYAATAPDYYERVSEMASVVQFQPEVLEVLAASDHGAAVAHYLANHLDEADRLSRLPVHVAAVQIGRIEAQVSAPKPAKPVSNAPEPAPKVGGASAAPRGLSDDISIDEWMKRRSAKS